MGLYSQLYGKYDNRSIAIACADSVTSEILSPNEYQSCECCARVELAANSGHSFTEILHIPG
jgi:hypothetical protein